MEYGFKKISNEKICITLLNTLSEIYSDAKAEFKAGVACTLSEISLSVGKE